MVVPAFAAAEIEADAVLKVTTVDGVYDKDPLQFPNAKKFKKITHMEMIQKRLRVLDSTAASLCMENKIPIIVLNVTKVGNIKKAVLGQGVGTTVEVAKE